MQCPECQTVNPDTAKFCNKCGCPQSVSQIQFVDYFKNIKSYTPKFLADKILNSKAAIEGERKNVTVLFADVADFTTISEKLDPETVHQIMEGCFNILLDHVHSHQGTINQFTGDGIMAIFGAPLAIENHALSSCLAALAIQQQIKHYNKEMINTFGVDFKMRIGINSGTVVVGSIGGDLRMDYTAIGDTTNLAARMESMADPGKILIAPKTFNLVNRFFEFTTRGKVRVKGKSDPMVVYELLGKRFSQSKSSKDRQVNPEMVGRVEEISKLEIQVNKAVIGEGSVVNVIGHAGIGKSRLIAELKKREAIKRVTLLEGRAISIGKNLSFHPVIDLLKQWAKISESESESKAFNKLHDAVRSIHPDGAEEILPFVATLMGIKPFGRYAKRVKGIEGEALENLIVKNVRELVIRGSKLKPTVIIMEDLHWADDSSIKLLENLYRLAENHRLLFINVLRPGYLEEKLDKISNVGEKLPVYFVEIQLKPLGIDDSKALIQNMLAIRGLPHAIRDRIIEKTGGNPYFIEEVIRSLIDDGTIKYSQTGFHATQAIKDSFIPSSVNDVLITRIDRLEEQTKELIKVASVIGRSFFDRVIKDVAFSIEDVDDRLAHLKEIQLLRDRIRMQELEYLFKHALAQEAVYDSILIQKQKALHLLVAQSIERVFSKRLNEFYGMLAYHYNKAEELKKAEEFMIKAGDEALKSSASNEALNYFQEALNLYLGRIGADADPDKLIAFDKNIAIALFNKGNFASSVEYFDRVLTKLGDSLPKYKIGIILNLLHGASVVLVSLYLPFLKGSKVPTEQDNEYINLIFKRNIALVHIDHIRAFLGCLKLYKTINKFDASLLENATQMLISFGGHIVFSGISFNLSKKFLDSSRRMIYQNNVRDLISYRAMKTMFRLYSGTWDEIGEYEEQLIDDSLRNGELWAACAYMLTYGHIKSEQGNFQEVESLIRDLLNISNAYGYQIAKIYYYILQIDLLIKTMDYDQASITTESAYILATKIGMEMNQIQFVSYKSISETMLNELDRAKDLIEQADNIFGNQRFLPPIFIMPYFLGQIIFNLNNFTQIMASDNQLGLTDSRKKTYKFCKAALKISSKYAPHRVGILKFVGLYYWLINKQSKAIICWKRSINEGERIGARFDLCRTYFEVGKRLLEPKSKFKEVNGIDAQGYLDKAKTMFEEMELQYHLDELDRLLYSYNADIDRETIPVRHT